MHGMHGFVLCIFFLVPCVGDPPHLANPRVSDVAMNSGSECMMGTETARGGTNDPCTSIVDAAVQDSQYSPRMSSSDKKKVSQKSGVAGLVHSKIREVQIITNSNSATAPVPYLKAADDFINQVRGTLQSEKLGDEERRKRVEATLRRVRDEETRKRRKEAREKRSMEDKQKVAKEMDLKRGYEQTIKTQEEEYRKFIMRSVSKGVRHGAVLVLETGVMCTRCEWWKRCQIW